MTTTNQQLRPGGSSGTCDAPRNGERPVLGQRYRIPEGSWRVCRYCGHECGIINAVPFGFHPKKDPTP